MKIFETILIAALGGLIGNFVGELIKSHVRKNQASENRRDIQVKQILVCIDDLYECGKVYWSKSNSQLGEAAMTLEAEMVGKQQNIAEQIAELFTGEQKHNCDIAYCDFMSALTGDDFFGSLDRPASKAKLIGIHKTTLTLKLEIQKARASIPRKLLT